MKNEKKKFNSKRIDAKGNQLNDNNLENVSSGLYSTTDMYGQPKIFSSKEEMRKYEQRRDAAKRNQISQNAIKLFQNPGNN